MSTDQPKQPPEQTQTLEKTPKQTPKSIHNDMLELKDKLAKVEGSTSIKDKGIFRKLDELSSNALGRRL